MPRNTQSTSPKRSLVRLVLYCAATLVAVGSIGAYFYLSRRASQVTVINTPANAHDAFDGRYQLAWRGDGAAGNTEVEAVYYFPTLIGSLNAYTDRTELQAETLSEIQQNAQSGWYPILVMLQHNEAFAKDFTLDGHVALKDNDGVTYTLQRWQPVALPDTSGKGLAGVLWFSNPNATATIPASFTLTLSNLPGNTKTSSFSWNAALLDNVQ